MQELPHFTWSLPKNLKLLTAEQGDAGSNRQKDTMLLLNNNMHTSNLLCSQKKMDPHNCLILKLL